MTFTELAAAYLTAPAVPGPPVPQTAARRCGTRWSPSPRRVGGREPCTIGSNRAAALGEPVSGVVVAAFGVFEPAFLAGCLVRAAG